MFRKLLLSSSSEVTLAHTYRFTNGFHIFLALAQMVACLPLVEEVQGSVPGGVVNLNLKIFNLGVRRVGDVHFLIARLYITGLN